MSPFVSKPFNPYHENEYTQEEFRKTLQKHFEIEGLYGQDIVSGWGWQQMARVRSWLYHAGMFDLLPKIRIAGRKTPSAIPEVEPKNRVREIPEKGNHQPMFILAVCRKK